MPRAPLNGDALVGMNTNEPTQPTAEAVIPVTATGNAPVPLANPGITAGAPPSPAAPGQQVLDLVALLVLIAMSAAVFALAGPGALTAVTSVGLGLFATWRSSHPRPPRR